MRGVGTPAGDAQMSLVWTNTVPRRLVDASTGQPVGNLYPGLTASSAPRASFPPNADGVSVSSRSVAPRTRSVIGEAPSAARQDVATAAVAPIRVASDHRHVLAATYASRAEADRAFARLAAAGLPMRLGQINRTSGMVYAVVAGPFASTDALVSGLRTTQAAGFAAATTRR
jgi:cell division protein FtsN